MAVSGTLYIQAQTVQLMFDAALTVPNETHSFGNEIVSQTLEDGSNISDHIIILQDELEVQIFVSNSVLQESQDTYAALKTIRNKRELCTVFTDHEIYENMAIESVSAPHEAPMVNSITFTVKFKRIDWVGAVVNTYPPAKFQPQVAASMAPGYKHEQQAGMQEAVQGKMGPVDAVDMTASATQDVGEIAGKQAGGTNGHN